MFSCLAELVVCHDLLVRTGGFKSPIRDMTELNEVGNRLSYAAKMRVRGKLPQKRDIVDYGNTKILQFLKFVDFFTVDGKFDTSVSKVAEAQMRGEDEDFFDEFLERINITPGKDGGTSLRFRLRLTTFARIVLSWIKNNPHAVTEEMMEIMEKNPRLSWASKAFKMVTTEMGVQVVERDNDERTDAGIKNKTPDASNVNTPMVKFEQAKLSMLTLLQALSKSIPASELKQMSVKDKIAAFDRLLNTATKVMGQSRPNSVIFQSININKANRDELEKSFLSYAESQVDG
jgi:hypothetical protein